MIFIILIYFILGGLLVFAITLISTKPKPSPGLTRPSSDVSASWKKLEGVFGDGWDQGQDALLSRMKAAAARGETIDQFLSKESQ